MLDEELAQLAIRARAATLVVAATGETSLSATSTGYARAAGSFVADRFVVGQEVTPSGFPQTAVGVITAVSALEMRISGGRTVASADVGRSLVSGLPALRAYENVGFTPVSGRPYVTEELAPGASRVFTMPTTTGRHQEEFLSIWTWYGLSGTGIGAIKRGVKALKALFAAGTQLDLTDGSMIRVRGDTSVRNSQVEQIAGGWAACQVVIPFRISTRNAVLT